MTSEHPSDAYHKISGHYGARGKLIAEHFRDQGLQVAATFDFRRWDAAKCQFVSMSPEQRTAALRDLSPMTHVSADDPPTLLVPGDQDKLVPVQQSRTFKHRMDRVGATCELLVADGKGHGWDHPVENELEWVIGWFDKHLAAQAVE